MLMIMMGALMMRIDTPLAPPSDACEIGRLAVADLRPAPSSETYLEVDLAHSELIKLCPALGPQLPQGIAAANARARSSATGKRPWRGARATVYTIEIPRLVADRDHAAAEVWLRCGGLCGRGHILFYVRTTKGWRRDGKPTPSWVS